MRITYLNHSGIAIEKDDGIFVIDCFDPRKHVLLQKLDGYRNVAFLSSHIHGDHYSPDIFKYGGDLAVYLLSFDIPQKRGSLSISPGESLKIAGVTIAAFGSTDEGVSFLLSWPDGQKIFHAGDLNNWHWLEEGGEEYAKSAEKAFCEVLDSIKEQVPAGSLTAACFPVDPRMGRDYWRGAVQFAKALRPQAFIPIHFGAAFDPPQGFYDEIAPCAGCVLAPKGRDEVVLEV